MRLGKTLALNISYVDIASNNIHVSKILTHNKNIIIKAPEIFN